MAKLPAPGVWRVENYSPVSQILQTFCTWGYNLSSQHTKEYTCWLGKSCDLWYAFFTLSKRFWISSEISKLCCCCCCTLVDGKDDVSAGLTDGSSVLFLGFGFLMMAFRVFTRSLSHTPNTNIKICTYYQLQPPPWRTLA